MALALSLALILGGAVVISEGTPEAGTCGVDSTSACNIEARDRALKMDITCNALKGNQIDWDCIFGPESLEEVFQRGGIMTTCPEATKSEPCSRFIVEKEEERSEVKVQEGPEGFGFKKGERYVFKYSFKAKRGMRVAKKFTHLGQLKGSKGGRMIKGDPIYSLTANNNGLMVRFSNKESIEDYHPGMDMHLDWDKATGKWVHVKITTVFGESMEVELSGAVSGKAVWPKYLKPVAWHRDSEMVRMKLGLYHSKGNVHDQEVIYKNISIEGPRGIIRTSNKVSKEKETGEPGGYAYKGCFRDTRSERVFRSKSSAPDMTTRKCIEDCRGSEYIATQHGRECWCGDSRTDFDKHGKAVCDYSCSGEGAPGEKCGGEWAMSVYEEGGKPSNVPDGTKYLGCYGDKASERALTLARTVDGDRMTYERCRDFCKKKGAKHMGLEWSRECFCESSKDDFDVYGDAVCMMPCSGDSKSICGGPDAMSVFRIF